MSNAKNLDVLRYALQQYGYTESPPGSNGNKFGKEFGMNFVPWCAEYVWCCGQHPAGDNPIYKSANAADIQDMTVKHKGGKYILPQTSNNTKKKEAKSKFRFGDSVSFNFNGGTSRAHTGMVVGVVGDTVYCIEGNTSFSNSGSQSNGGCVALRARSYKHCVCVVRPKYTECKFYVPTTAFTGAVPKLPSRGYFKYGDKSAEVKKLQIAMAWANGYNLKVDKQFGGGTFAEVVIFQLANGLTPDGDFGKKSLDKLNALIKKHATKTEQTTAKPEQKVEQSKSEETKVTTPTTTTTSNADNKIVFPQRGYFTKGDSGGSVKEVQKLLNKANKGSKEPDLTIDGDYGDKTVAAVKQLQDVRHITIDGQFGKKTLKEAEKKVTKPMMAVAWMVSVARDNTFTYGAGKRAHRGGCYFCGTNTGPVKKIKEKKGEPHYVKDSQGNKHTYEKTYCCNPFAFSAYAHGAKDKAMLKKCQAGGNATTGMNPKAWAKWGFTILGKCKNVPYDKLKVGDVVMCKSHVWVYAGDGHLVEASGGNWGKDSIAHKAIAKSRYASYQKDKTAYVVRYKG